MKLFLTLSMLALLMVSSLFVGAGEFPELPAKLDINTAERMLFDYNLAVIAARHGVDASVAARVAATYTPNPTLTIGSEQLKTDRHLKNYAGDTGGSANPTYTFRVDQQIETGGKKKKRTEVADMQVLANEAMVIDQLRLQTLQMKQFFYSALLARENLKSAKEISVSIATTEDLLAKQAKNGNIPEADLIKFQANKISYERDISTAQLSYEQAIRDLINTLGTKPVQAAAAGAPAAPALELTGELIAPETEYNLDEMRARSEQRSDVIAAKRALDVAEKTVESNRAQRWVDPTVGVEYQRVGGDNTVGVVVAIPLPLYNNHKANINNAESLRNQAFAQYQQAKLQASADVDKAYQAVTSNRRIVKLYASGTLDRAKESLDIVQKAYDRKSASLLDLLDAQRTYKQTLQAAHQAQYDLLVSIAQLESATGLKKNETKEQP